VGGASCVEATGSFFMSATLGRFGFFCCLAAMGGLPGFLLVSGGEPSRRGRFGLVVFSLGSGFCLRGTAGLAVLALALASAICLRASSVAPVRGGTYFSLPPQRKVGKRKRLTPPARVLIHGPPTSLRCTWQRPCSRSLPTLRTSASPASNTRTRTGGSEWYVPPRWQTVCRLSRRIAWRSYRVERVRYWSGVRRVCLYGLHTVCHLGGRGLSGKAC